MASDSSRSNYKKHLASFAFKEQTLYTVEANNVDHLKSTFEEIHAKNEHVELMLMEPVMGEGNPGVPITREFYDAARAETDDKRSLLLVDAIQAGIRTTGSLSLMDAPGFETASPPDFETYSKAINGGQYPFSVLALGPRVPEIYHTGLYGNTMTTNPRALEVCNAVLDSLTPELRMNVREMGVYFKEALLKLRSKHPDMISDVTGTGLLVACHLKEGVPAYGANSVEILARKNGLGVIHGGKNALRFTPHFLITPTEVDLIVELLDETLAQFKAGQH